MSKISVLINTLNEEKNIRNCLESVKWTDEIILVDMWSDDKTIEIAKEYTDKIFMHKRLGYADPARQFALDKASNEWILVIDADEIVPIQLKEKLLEIISENQFDAVLIPHNNYFFGHHMRGTGWGPLQDGHIRFFKKKIMSYGDRIHSFTHLDPEAKIYKISNPEIGFIHFNYIDVEHFLDKLNRYTTIEAINAYTGREKFSVKKVIFSTVKEFILRFILKKGYKDGFHGFALAFLMSTYRLSSYLKLMLIYKYNTTNVRNIVLEMYSDIAKSENSKSE